MNGIRRALLWASADRYLGLIVNFVLLATISRILTPAEIGVSVIGVGLITIAQTVREFATPEFLIPRAEVTRVDAQTAFTIMVSLSAIVSAVLLVLAPWLAAFYAEPGLAPFIQLIAAANFLSALPVPITTLMKRDMAFAHISVINVATTLTNAGVTILLGLHGFSYLAIGWALVAAAAVTCILAFALRPDLLILRPAVASWRKVLHFGGYNGGLSLLRNAFDSLPQLALARILPLPAIGLYNRALTLSSIPDKFVLAGILAVAFPAFAAGVREGRPLPRLYLQTLSYITAVYWPTMILVALLARPIVTITLGPQWMEAVPLVQILALANLFWFPSSLTYPVLASVGAIRDGLVVHLITLPASAVVLIAACLVGGLEGMAFSQFVTIPFQMYVTFLFIRRHAPFSWSELVQALRPSAIVALCSAAAAGFGVAATSAHDGPSLLTAAVTLPLAAAGWGVGLRITRHPVFGELARTAAALGRRIRGIGSVRRRSMPSSSPEKSW